MNVYPIGNNLIVKWTLRYSDGTVFPLSLYDYDLSYRTSRGVKVATDTTVEDNVLRWMLKADDQVVSGPYSLELKISFAGNKAVDLQYNNAFALTSLSHGNGANVEVCIESNCDMIDLKDAVLQARKAMDLAANAVIDTANSAADAKAAKEAAEVTAAQAKVDAESAKTIAADAKDQVAVAEKAATDASRYAVASQQAAQTASDHITSLQQAIAELPDGQAVSEKVAEHTIQLTELESEVNIMAFRSIFTSKNIEIGKYIKGDGTIDVAIDTYRLAKFEIGLTSKFLIVGHQTPDRPFLVKYTDSSYSVVDTIIIPDPDSDSGMDIKEIKELTSGYYAVSWNVSNGNATAICDIKTVLNENRSVFNTAFSASNIKTGRYIASDGAISFGIDSYRLVKLEITEPGKYFLSNIGNAQRILAKYTDKGCTIFEKFVVGTSDDYSGIVELEQGYYVLSWNVDFFANNPTFFNFDDIIDVINLTIPRSIIYDIACENIKNQYITDAGGIEPAYEKYRLGKFEITEAGKYYLGESIYDESHPTLAKFADSSYSGNGQILIGASSTPVDGLYYLEPGFYALCGSNCQTIVVTYISGIEKCLDSLYQKKHNFGGGITDFSGLLQNTPGAWSIVSKDKIESVSTGYANRIYFPIATYEDYFLMSVVVTPKTTNNGNWEFVFGRDSSAGTLVHIGQDANGKFAAIYCADTLYQRYDLSALRMGVGRALSIVLEKSLDTLNFFNLTITDEAGNVFTQERIVSFDQSTGNFAAGLGYGPLTMYGITGAVALEKLSFVYPKDANDIKLAICGHSFVAGHNSTIYNQDKKFASLLATDVGLKNTCVFGLGGGGVDMIPALSLQLDWISSVRYVIIMLGANDNDNAATATAFQSFYDSIKSMGAFPIWLTIPKLRDGTQAKPYLSQYIKDHFFYVDVDRIFVDEYGNIIPSMYGDFIHPSIEGYRRMYEVIKNQCSFIFGV